MTEPGLAKYSGRISGKTTFTGERPPSPLRRPRRPARSYWLFSLRYPDSLVNGFDSTRTLHSGRNLAIRAPSISMACSLAAKAALLGLEESARKAVVAAATTANPQVTRMFLFAITECNSET